MISIIIQTLNRIGSKTPEYMPKLKLFDAVGRLAAISPDHINLNQKQYRAVQTECSTTSLYVIPSCWKACEKTQPTGFALRWPCDPRPRSSSLKWYKLAEVNGAYKHAGMKKMLKNLCVMSNLKVLVTEADGQTEGHGCLAGQTGLITKIHMLLIWTNNNKKKKKLK